ncbi:hypothetical protein K466DRAFT_606074 [Polyporus arcularius HHB13444]|uniref:Uncharacterized protein n=1 Tax=Polyporus arcularius HHB13444 TaxID=1314778 RepID=A0A5C3NSJ0_9APHY|nr:hypothetical protein K466DRAFT_606074 [Polyporus arcularius HHB13444]
MDLINTSLMNGIRDEGFDPAIRKAMGLAKSAEPDAEEHNKSKDSNQDSDVQEESTRPKKKGALVSICDVGKDQNVFDILENADAQAQAANGDPLDRFLAALTEPITDPILYWHAHVASTPGLACMGLDYSTICRIPMGNPCYSL